MTCVIFGAVPMVNWDFLSDYLPQSYGVICADGGIHNAKRAGIAVDAVIGDWDSGGAPVEGIPAYPLPIEKNMTDVQAAIDLGLAQGYRDFLLCGCLGGRIDHTAFNLLLLEWIDHRGGRGILLDGDNEVRLLSSDSVTISHTIGYRYLSVLPLDATVDGVSISGVKYPLTNATLTRGETLTVSNEPVGEQSTVTVGCGTVLLIRSEKKP